MLPLLRLWTGPLPHQELYPDRKVNPLLHWFIHPLKRRIAKYYLLFLQRISGLKVIAITGSAGKTTTKDLLTNILSLEGPTVATRDNITPTYNIPSSILKCSMRTRYLVLEMGVEYPGDMDFYTWLARPDIAVITAINLTHTYHLGTLADVAAEKGRLLSALTTSGSAVINADDPNIQTGTSAQVFKFGTSPDNFVQIVNPVISPDLKTQMQLVINHKSYLINLSLIGRHFAASTAAAASAASLLSARPQNIVHGLETTPTLPHRMQLVPISDGPLVLDDSYNANPLAVIASLDTLIEISRLTGKIPVFVFGQMNELGQYEQPAHEEVGEKIKKLDIKYLFCTGPATKFTLATAGVGQYFETVDELTTAVSKFLNASHCTLIKASRSFHFETIVEALTQKASVK